MRYWRLALLLLFIAWPLYLLSKDPAPGQAALLDIDGAIGPATSDYIHRSLEEAKVMNAALVILRMDTPGGLDTAMRDIIQDIIASPVPVATFVAPSGARAASAGTYILYASHIAAMAPATNLGAATPVQIGGMPAPGSPDRPTPPKQPDKADKKKTERDKEQPNDEAAKPAETGDTLKRKQVSDAVAYIRGLAQMRGRNVEWAEKAVREAASLPAEEAVKLNVADLLAENVDDLLKKIDGRKVNVLGQEMTLDTKGLQVVRIEPDWRTKLLSIITDPNVAYILMMLGVYGLFFELSNPGYVLPGVLGAISLLLALYAFQVLPVNYAGLALIILGVSFMVAEAFLPSFGALGIGGVIAFVVGSIILIDTDVKAFQIVWPLIASVGLASFLFFSIVVAMLIKARHRRVVSGVEELVGSIGEVLESFKTEGRIRIHSEDWNAHTQVPVQRGQKVRVTGIDGLVLKVEPEKPEEES